jgi:ribonuclease D
MRYIKTQSELDEAVAIMRTQSILGIDIECENNLHHYGSYISIIQVSSKTEDWIIDVLVLKKIDSFLSILADEKIQKVFHDIDFDFRILMYEFSCVPKNIFDTKLAAQFLGKQELGLSSLIKDYFQYEKKKKFQMVDWTKRPLSSEMLAYAAADSHYLISLTEKLTAELTAKGRLNWFIQECNSRHPGTLLTPSFEEVKGLKLLSEIERGRLKVWYELRETLAKKVNRPTHYIIPTKKLFEFAKNPPTLDQWKTLKAVHPLMRQNAEQFYNAGLNAVPFVIAKRPIKKLPQKLRDDLAKIEEKKNALAQKLGIAPHLIASKDQTLALVLGEDSLRDWQKELLK